ncbi:glycoside hydrolase family 18 protein [Pediococcus acidilactici]|uniref:glycoside hydrolase family 18 protein n=1 Tax=Pediococcus acidilactici TaxID=1254 RepID=UPI000326DB44|nr:glycoside hydrolase family 18 protein [Pediococcus acidilactici]EOA09038.1 chitinase C [Pediococcus acidilactici D3]MBW4796539.1 glycoside hydrolase family 18 protein [Pediococcus acidilactici]MBW9305793.1 glycoside hydrolase family 18 protein [Pediococcus acidilactici]MCE5961785.1 glycoside hydrolase family 18 protein [Pediococcus acidilactici]MCW8082729.1 glycoside hydrolase family 18 protein [Pediococcus acidilactici]
MTVIMGYLHGRQNWKIKQIPGEKLTHINYAFAKIEGLNLVDKGAHFKQIATIKQHFPNLKVNISIGGWGAEGFSDAVLNADSRNKFATNIINFIQQYGIDGVDFDWEYPGSALGGIKSRTQDAENFYAFLKVLREKLASCSDEYEISAAIAGDPSLLTSLINGEKLSIAEYLDYLNVMTYDLRGSWTNITGHQTNLFPYDAIEGELSIDTTVKYLIAKQVPTDKIVIGSAAYSRDWREVDQQAPSPVGALAKEKGTQTTPYQKISQLIAQKPQCYFWDEKAKAPYYFDEQVFRSFDDEKSMESKVKYVQQQRLGGLMLWELSLDPQNQLISAATNALDK